MPCARLKTNHPLGTFRELKVRLSPSELPYLSNPVQVDNYEFSFLMSRLYCQMLTNIQMNWIDHFLTAWYSKYFWEKSDIVIAILVNSPFQIFHKIFLSTSNFHKFSQCFARAFLANVLYNYLMSEIADELKPPFPIEWRK